MPLALHTHTHIHILFLVTISILMAGNKNGLLLPHTTTDQGWFLYSLLSVSFKWSLSLSDNVKFLMMPVVYHFTFLLGYYYHIYCHNRISSLKYQRQFLWLVAQLDNSSNNDVSSLITSLSLSRIQRMISLYHVI